MNSDSPSQQSLRSDSRKLLMSSSSKLEQKNHDLLLNSRTPEKPADLPGRRSDSTARKQILSQPSDSLALKVGNGVGEGSSKEREESYILVEFFDGLDAAVRLSKMKGAMPTFTNIRPKIEALTRRSFSYGHLAQMKYLFPEAIEIKRILKFDEKSSCMIPDLHVTLNLDAVESDGNFECQSKNIRLRKVFHARLEDFAKAHPLVGEIPKKALPEPFNNLQQNPSQEVAEGASSINYESSNDQLEYQKGESSASYPEPNAAREEMQAEQLAVASHVSRAQRHHIISPDEKNISSSAFSRIKFSSKPVSDVKCVSYHCSPTKWVSSWTPATPVKDSIQKEMPSTPAECASTPARLMSATPAQRPPKRCYISPDDNHNAPPNKLIRCPSRSTRSLKFDIPEENEYAEDVKISEDVKDEVSAKQGASSDKDLPDSLPDGLQQNEKKAVEDPDPVISQAERQKDRIACLIKLFNVVKLISHSIRNSVITKEELVHKIIATDCNIVDRGEVEQQLSLMLELVPEWISQRNESSGDLLFCINKRVATESIRARLGKAAGVS